MTDIKSIYGPWQILAIIGGVIGIVAFFLTWMSIDTYVLGNLTSSTPYSGIDIMNLDGSDFQKYIPVITLALSAIMLVIAIIPGGKIPEQIGGIVVLVLGVVILVLAVVFVMWLGYYSAMEETLRSGWIANPSFGFYLGAVAGVLGLVSGLLKLVKKV